MERAASSGSEKVERLADRTKDTADGRIAQWQDRRAADRPGRKETSQGAARFRGRKTTRQDAREGAWAFGRRLSQSRKRRTATAMGGPAKRRRSNPAVAATTASDSARDRREKGRAAAN